MPRLPLILALALAVAALPKGAWGQAQPFDIYVNLPITGQVAFLGSETALGVRALQGYINAHGGIRGRPVNFVISDDQSNPQVELQLFSQELTKKPAVIVGGELVAMCRAAQGLINKETGPVYYCLSPGVHPPPGDWTYSGTFSTIDMLAVSIRYLRDRGITKIATITTTDASGQDGDTSIASAAGEPENKDVQIVDKEHFTVGDISVAAQLSRIQASGAQAIIAWLSGSPLATVLHGVRDAGMKQAIITSPSNLVYRQLEDYKDMMPAGPLWIPGIPSVVPDAIANRGVHQAVVDFVAAMKQQGVDKPDVSASVPWDAMQIIVDAYRKLGFDATAAQIRDYINGVRNYDGILGVFNYAASPQRGAQRQWCLMVRWDPAAESFVAISQPGGAPLK